MRRYNDAIMNAQTALLFCELRIEAGDVVSSFAP